MLVQMQPTYTHQWSHPLMNATLVWLNQSRLLVEHVITGCVKSEFTRGVKSSVPLFIFAHSWIKSVKAYIQYKGSVEILRDTIVSNKMYSIQYMAVPLQLSCCGRSIKFSIQCHWSPLCQTLNNNVPCLVSKRHSVPLQYCLLITGKSLLNRNIGIGVCVWRLSESAPELMKDTDLRKQARISI